MSITYHFTAVHHSLAFLTGNNIIVCARCAKPTQLSAYLNKMANYMPKYYIGGSNFESQLSLSLSSKFHTEEN